MTWICTRCGRIPRENRYSLACNCAMTGRDVTARKNRPDCWTNAPSGTFVTAKAERLEDTGDEVSHDKMEMQARMMATTRGRQQLQADMVEPLRRASGSVWGKRYIPPPLGVADIMDEEQWTGEMWVPVITDPSTLKMMREHGITPEDIVRHREAKEAYDRTLKGRWEALCWTIRFNITEAWESLRYRMRGERQ